MEFSSIPLAFFAGILSLISPCVLPMLPAVAASSMNASRWGLVTLALGISTSFALAGTLITFVLLNLGISTEWIRYMSIALLGTMGVVMLIPVASLKLSAILSRFSASFGNVNVQGDSVITQGLVGVSLGLIWLPCVGPTLGAAIALASTGQNMLMAFLVMLSFGLGTAIPLVLAGHFSGKKLVKLKQTAFVGKYFLGITLIILAVMISTNADRMLEAWAIEFMPDWVSSI